MCKITTLQTAYQTAFADIERIGEEECSWKNPDHQLFDVQ